MKTPAMTDTRMERMISVLLRTGVLVSGAIVLAGGLLYLARHGKEPADYHVFHSESSTDRLISQIVAGALSLRARSIVQVGIVLLIATPIARVALSLFGFALERDRVYVMVTAIVLAVLLYSLISGAVGG